MTFQDIIDSIENLSREDQDYLFALIQKRRTANRRVEIATKAKETLASLKEGTAKRGTVDDLITDLLEDDGSSLDE